MRSDTDSTKETKSETDKVLKKGLKKSKHYPTLLQQIKDNSWMEDILEKKANNEKLSDYDKFLFSKMKEQPLPTGGITKLLKKYKKKNTKKAPKRISKRISKRTLKRTLKRTFKGKKTKRTKGGNITDLWGRNLPETSDYILGDIINGVKNPCLHGEGTF